VTVTLTWKNSVELRGFEPLTPSMRSMAIPSGAVVRRHVTAARRGSAVVARRDMAGSAWGRCHLARHWPVTAWPTRRRSRRQTRWYYRASVIVLRRAVSRQPRAFLPVTVTWGGDSCFDGPEHS
jgi:hypothetical protein